VIDVRRRTIVALSLPFAAFGELSAQSPSLSLPVAPVVHGTLGPLIVRATVSERGIGIRVSGRSAGRAASTAGRPAARAAAVLRTADRHVGAPYRWGGTTPSGFDCSGFVQYVFRRHAVELPRTSRQQVEVGRAVGRRPGALRPGDLMFFASAGGRIDHVAIYAGGNRILHATASGGMVRYDDLATSRGRWFSERHVASRRVLENGQSLVRDLDLALRAAAAFDPPDSAPRPRGVPRGVR
jgi:cell wall-associated NlpC family hydrolase